MITVSSFLSFLKNFAELHHRVDRPIEPTDAGTLASLLNACSREAADMEAKLYPVTGTGSNPNAAAHESTSAENIIHVSFNRPAPSSPPPSGDGAA